jgi:anti-sigma regulatory factor (Ser/Thr protein kinase)
MLITLWTVWMSRGVGAVVKDFFGADERPRDASVVDSVEAAPSAGVLIPQGAIGRIAVYDGLTAAPRVEDITTADPSGFIEQLAARTYQAARDHGGAIPYTLIREIVENFIHARFAEVVVTILDAGNTIRFSDQGPGILDKERAFVPGFTTASSSMKRVIRGVGSGLPIVKECLSFSDGSISIEDNLGTGTVVTLRVQAQQVVEEPVEQPEEEAVSGRPRLSMRQKQVLSLVMEYGSVGPSAVSNELKVALSTAYRDLAFLEDAGLVDTDASGKRALTEDGLAFLDGLFTE